MIHRQGLANRQALILCVLVFLTVVTTTSSAAESTEGSQILLVPAQFGTIQSAIDAAVDGDTVQVAPGTYPENIDFLGKDITVTSEAGPASTFIDPSASGRPEIEIPPRHFETRRYPDGRVEVLGLDGQPWLDAMGILRFVPPWPEGGPDSVIIFENGESRDAVLEGFTITGGLANRGGGMRIEGASPTVRDNIITDNRSCSGGAGIAIVSASPLVEGNTITHNLQQGCTGGLGGGGILVWEAGTAEIRGNIVGHNRHCSAGGIRLHGAGAPFVIDNIIHNNYSFNRGGGLDIVNPSSELIVQNLIYGNDGRNGDGVAWVGNSETSGPRFVNNTIAYNGDVGVYAAGIDGGTRLENNLIIGTPGRTAFACEGLFDFDLPNLDFNNVFTGFGGIAYNFACDDVTGMDGNISADPLFVDPSGSNFRLAAGSASVDAANNNANFLPFFDLDGNTRLFDGDGDMLAVVDHGAYEQGSKPPPPVDPNTWHVPADFATIQKAIDGAFPGDNILVAAGTYMEEIDFRGKALHLASVDGPAQTIIDAAGGAPTENAGSVVVFSNGERRGSVLEGFTITGGEAWFFGGGGIYMELASPTIRGNIITGNQACDDGGGIRVINGSPLIEDNVISDNGIMGCTVGRGGGIALEGASDNDAEIRGNVISGNAAVWGGGIRIRGVSAALVIDNRIVGNSAAQSGGGMDIISNFEGALIQNRFEDNDSDIDLGEDLAWNIAGQQWIPRMVNNTVVATGSGPSLLLDGFNSVAEVTNNIVLAADGALGIECGDSGDSTAPIFRHNNVFSATGTPYGALCGTPTGSDGNISQDPRLVDPAGGDLRLRGDSPSIDAGEGGIRDLPPEDFEGDARSLDGDGDGTVTLDQGVDEAPLDTTPPMNPQSLESTSHVPMTWSTTVQIDVEWFGAADDLPLGSGVAGYSVLFDTAANTQIDDIVDLPHGTEPHATGQGVSDGMHYVHLRTCDLRNNCAATVHLGPFWVDTTAPTVPTALMSPSHQPNVVSSDPTIDLSWNAASDTTSGVVGYRVLVTTSDVPTCDGGDDLGSTTTYTTAPLSEDSWYVHLCSLDGAGNLSAPATVGPFLINPLIFRDGFESGQTDGWSRSVP